METKIIISVCFIIIFIICGVFLYKWLKKDFNKKLYIYPKTEHLYLLIYRCKLKCPSTGEWFDAIIYKGVEDERYYVREKKDFFDKFVKLIDWKDGDKSGQC